MGFADATQFWNERFNKVEFIFGTEPNQYLLEKASQYLKPNQRVLSIADGEGRNGVWLAKQGMQVVAFDASDVALAKAKQFAKENQVELEYTFSDVDSFAWHTNTYDAVIGIFIQFADPAMRERIFQKTYEALKPGGHLYSSRLHTKAVRVQNGWSIPHRTSLYRRTHLWLGARL